VTRDSRSLSGAAKGDYPLTVTVARAGTTSPTGSFTTYYEIYFSARPEAFWPGRTWKGPLQMSGPFT